MELKPFICASEVLLITITIWGINIASKFWTDSNCLTLTWDATSRNGQRQAWWPKCAATHSPRKIGNSVKFVDSCFHTRARRTVKRKWRVCEQAKSGFKNLGGTHLSKMYGSNSPARGFTYILWKAFATLGMRLLRFLFFFCIRHVRWQWPARISWRNSADEGRGCAQEYR